MNRIRSVLVWISRLRYSRGFGIQSPSDYWFVCHVINEHWPYYQYAELGADDSWLRRKMGLLCFRLANWRQPRVISSDDYTDYLHAGCHKAVFGKGNELLVVRLDSSKWETQLDNLLTEVDENSVVVIDGIWRNKSAWHKVVTDKRSVITFDLYYCGIVLFNPARTKKNYIINF